MVGSGKKAGWRSAPIARAQRSLVVNEDGTAENPAVNVNTGDTTGESWVYRALRTVFEASHCENEALLPSEPLQTQNQSPNENILSVQQSETDSEMTISTGNISAQHADDTSLPLPNTDTSSTIVAATTAAVGRHVSDCENFNNRSENTSIDDNGSVSIIRIEKGSSTSTAERTETIIALENEAQLLQRDQKSPIQSDTIGTTVFCEESSTRDASRAGQLTIENLLSSKSPLPCEAQVAKSTSASASVAVAKASAPRLKDPPISSIALVNTKKAPPDTSRLAISTASGVCPDDSDDVIYLGTSSSVGGFTPDDDRKPEAIPSKNLTTPPRTKSRSSRKRKRSPREYRAWTGFPRHIEFQSSPPSLPSSLGKGSGHMECKRSPPSLPSSPGKGSAEKKFQLKKEFQDSGTVGCPESPKKQRRGLIYKTCRDKFRLDTSDIQRTIPVKDPSYFAISGQKKIFQIAILSKESAMMLAQQSFQMRGQVDTTMRDIRGLAKHIVRRCLGERVKWEFFLPDSGAYIKRELEPMILLRDYMDECNFGRQISVRVVSEYTPAVIQLNYAIEL